MNKRRNKNKWLYWLVGGVIVVAIIVAVVAIIKINHKNAGKEETEPQEVVQEEKEEKKEETEVVEEETEKEEVVQKEEIVQYDGEDPNDEAELSGAITYAGVAGSKLMIRVNIDQYLETGTCNLKLTRAGATIYTSTAQISAGAATATCEGFDVLTSELGTGTVQIQINLSADGKTGVISGEVEL